MREKSSKPILEEVLEKIKNQNTKITKKFLDRKEYITKSFSEFYNKEVSKITISKTLEKVENELFVKEGIGEGFDLIELTYSEWELIKQKLKKESDVR